MLSKAQGRRIPPDSHLEASHAPTWSSHSISAASRKSTQLPSTFDAHQKFERLLNQRGSIFNSSEGRNACKQLIINVNCHLHSTLRLQDKSNLKQPEMYRPELVSTPALLTAAKLDQAFVQPGYCITNPS